MPKNDSAPESDNLSEFEVLDLTEGLQPFTPSPKAPHSRAQLEAMLVTRDPAIATFTALGVHDFGEISMMNGQGTPRPVRVRVSLNKTRTAVALIPSTSSDPEALEVKYTDRRVQINLYDLFRSIDRFVPPGVREYYKLHRTPAPISIGNLTGYGLYFSLKDFESEPISKLSEEEKAKRTAARSRKETAAGEEPQDDEE
ncbi:MAG TPA: hypothetical protein VD902_14410 [Symbiobacteriaceae bacterium]|nr:hypothetical protein [Symbiobacteriaceae bacterium]